MRGHTLEYVLFTANHGIARGSSSETIASIGHTGVHAAQSMHSSG
jgi:hypothetical protein